VLSNVAARSRRIRLAPAVIVAPLHNPIRVPDTRPTLALLSGDRVRLRRRAAIRPASIRSMATGQAH